MNRLGKPQTLAFLMVTKLLQSQTLGPSDVGRPFSRPLPTCPYHPQQYVYSCSLTIPSSLFQTSPAPWPSSVLHLL